MKIQDLTDRAVLRIYGRFYRKMVRAIGPGGMAYGIDLPTLRIIRPDLARSAACLIAEMYRRNRVNYLANS